MQKHLDQVLLGSVENVLQRSFPHFAIQLDVLCHELGRVPGVGSIFPCLGLHGGGPLEHTSSLPTLRSWKRIETASAGLPGNLGHHDLEGTTGTMS